MEKLRKELQNKLNDLHSHGIYSSWTGFLHTCYDVACENKNYTRAHNIMELIHEDLND